MNNVILLEKQSIYFLRILNEGKYPSNEAIKDFFALFLKCSLTDIRGCQKVIELFDAISPDALVYHNKHLRYYWGILYKLMGYHIESEGEKMYNYPKERKSYIPQKTHSSYYKTYRELDEDEKDNESDDYKTEGYWGYTEAGLPYKHKPSSIADVYDRNGFPM